MSASEASAAPATTAGSGYPSPFVAWALVAVLFVAYIFSFIDRMIIGLLIEPLKADLGLSDTQVSLLQGFAFAIFYTVVGLPLGRLIDRAARMRIVAAGVALWSLMTASCGLATQYWQLFIARMGVGVGEATLSPAAYSIISDSFPQRRLGLAMGVYGLGSAVGAGLAFLIGAVVIELVSTAGTLTLPLIGELRAWQATFVIVGLPGLLIAGVFLVLPEPPRHGVKTDLAPAEAVIPLAEVWRFTLSRAGAVLTLCFAVAMVNLAVFAAVSWMPAFLIRVHELPLATAGHFAGGTLILGGLIGLIGGGWLSDRLGGGTASGRLAFCAVTSSIGTVFALVFPLVGNPVLTGIAFTIFFASSAVPIGAGASALQQLVPNRMRATLSALYLFIVNLIGLGLGPTAAALVGDTFFPTTEGIRYAIAIVSPLSSLAAAGLFFIASRYSRRHEGV